MEAAMTLPAIRKTRRPAGPTVRTEPAPVMDEFLASLSVEEDPCCCGRATTDPGRCGCDGDPESDKDCCCHGV
jgi:hypothetical protein